MVWGFKGFVWRERERVFLGGFACLVGDFQLLAWDGRLCILFVFVLFVSLLRLKCFSLYIDLGWAGQVKYSFSFLLLIKYI